MYPEDCPKKSCNCKDEECVPRFTTTLPPTTGYETTTVECSNNNDCQVDCSSGYECTCENGECEELLV